MRWQADGRAKCVFESQAEGSRYFVVVKHFVVAKQ
jgi:hypothetical protein